MPDANRGELINSLAGSHSKMQNIIEGIDLETTVYEDTDWQIRDILWHIAVWDRQVAKSINAFKDGSEYSIPDFDENEFNQTAYLDGTKLTEALLLDECKRARQDFEEAVKNFPADKYSSQFLYPWGDERGSIATLVADMVEHDEEHREEIKAAINLGE